MKKDFAVIFDCDGVMFDSRQANVNFYNHLLNRFNLPAMEEKQVPFIHMHTADESVQYLFRGTSHLEEAQAYRMNMDYTPFIKDMVIEPGLIELLRWLAPKFGLAVATNRSNTIEAVIEGNGLNGFFDIVVSSLDVQNPKPHPESLFKILNFFEIGPARALYVGDSPVDQDTARSAGTPFVAYKNSSLKAAYHVNALEEIRKIVGAGKNSK
ncbi:MAG: HAD-IA family hydrolase [Deltaproteobacteria bacterium]|nr:HAD-IA family hydrolase [Deltaproteobacteria bacterium]